MKRTSVLICLLFLSPVAGAAESGAFVDQVKLGAACMRTGHWREAEEVFRAILRTSPGHADVMALLGMSRYHLGKYDEASTNLEAALKKQTRYGARALYYLGLCRIGQNRKKEAEAVFTRLILMYPDSNEARNLGALPDDVVRDLLGVRRVVGKQVVVMLDGGYNTNPSRLADGDGDFFFSAYASGKISLFSPDFFAGGFLYAEKYFEEDENDYLSVGVNAEKEWRVSTRDSLQPVLQWSRSWYDSEAYETAIGLQCNYDRMWNERWDSNLRLEYQTKSDLTDGEGNSDADALGLRARGWRRCSGPGGLSRIKLEGEWESEDADAAYLGHDSVSLGVELRFSTTWAAVLDIGLEYEQREYAETNPTYSVTRDDSTLEIGMTVFRPVGRNNYWRFDLSHASRDSNIDDYTADETIFTAGVVWIP